MCGIAGLYSLTNAPIECLEPKLEVMSTLIQHRGPDGQGTWRHPSGRIGLAHRRLSIIDHDGGAQPMTTEKGDWLTYNGEIYNYLELQKELGSQNFRSKGDTEVILRAYERWGVDCLKHLRGMFSFALWDESQQRLLLARDRFGIKPLYFTVQNGVLAFASEVKALLPLMSDVQTDTEGLRDYLTFQFCLAGKTLFHNVSELLPGHFAIASNKGIEKKRYWEAYYNVDLQHTEHYFENQIRELMTDSIDLHLRSDQPVGAYLSGGLDSSAIATMASRKRSPIRAFHGRFDLGADYDESHYANIVAKEAGIELETITITSDDFTENLPKLIYHLDYPVAGPGSFSQFIVSRPACKSRKVVLGGQGADEIFGGYTRYLIAYFEQCIKAAIDGTMDNGNFIVTYESIIPNLVTLQKYKPLLQKFWSEGLFESMDRRYFRLVDRSSRLGSEIRWDLLPEYSPFDVFQSIFYGENVPRESYFNLMTHFDFKTLLPALLQVEDRVSMAWGLESRVPFLDHPLVEMAATLPANVKFRNGNLKNVFKNALASEVPAAIANRNDKMGFPTPITEWFQGPVKEFVLDTFSSQKARSRELINNKMVVDGLTHEPRYGRKIWGLLSLEIWQQQFHDKAAEFRRLLQ